MPPSLRHTLALAMAFGRPPALSAQEPARAYSIHLRTAEGRPVDGTLYLIRLNGRIRGRFFNTLRSTLAVDSAVLGPTTMVRAGPVAFRWREEGDSLHGEWRLPGQSGTVVGRRHPSVSDGSLRPVPCRVPRVDGLARCAVKLVPENRSAPDSRWIPLSVVVLPAGDSGQGALFLFAGGPGQASTDGAATNARRYASIREHRDLVMIDQRGTGGSYGLYCGLETAEERAEPLLGGFLSPAVVERCHRTLARQADLRFYHTAAATPDVEAVRTWLGYDRIDLYGGSYGTRAALDYLRRFPSRVRTITLRAILPPNASLVLDGPVNAQTALDSLFLACADDRACHAAYPELGREFGDLLRRVSTDPVSIQLRDPVTADSIPFFVTRLTLAGAVRRMLMDAGLQRRLPRALHLAAHGDFRPIQQGIEATLGVTGSLAWGMGLSVVCAEDPPLIRRRDVARATAGTFFGRDQVDGLMAACRRWDAGTPPPDYADPVSADVPALLLSGQVDPTTPPRWGAEVARTLPGAVTVVLPGIAHGPFPDCALSVMAAMVEAGRVGGLDLGCVERLTPPPFELP